MTQKKLSDQERKHRLDEMERRKVEEFNAPERVKHREWVKQVFNGDVDLIANFAVSMMMNTSALAKENEELVEKLNRILSLAHGLSSEESKAKPHERYNIARFSMELDPADPVARTFIAAMKIEKTLTATRRANKGHAQGNAAKKFVQTEWSKHREEYGNNKSEFARIYVKRVFNEHGVTITEKQLREIWLTEKLIAGATGLRSRA